MTPDPVRAALSGLVARLGVDLAKNAARCRIELDEACGAKLPVRRMALVAAIEQGVAGDLLNGLSSSAPKSALLDRLSQRLAASASLSSLLARWSVECWAVALGVVPESERLLVARLDAVLRQIDEAVTDSAIANGDLERIIGGAGRSGLEEADLRDFLAEYVSARGWRRRDPAVPEERAAPIPPAVPKTEPAAPFVAPAQPPELVMVRTRTQPAFLSKMPGWAVVTALGLAAFAVLAAVLLLRSAQTPFPEQPQRLIAPDQAQQQPALTEQERRAYDAAHGDVAALQHYVDTCRLCAYATEARAELHKLRAAALDEQERHEYEAAHGNPTALQTYIDTCRLCAYATEARGELRRLKAVADDEQAYRQAVGNIAALRAYAQSCDVCGFKATALDEIAKLQTQEPPASPSGEVRFQLYQHHDAPGNDILPLDGHEPDRGSCAGACVRTSGCVAYTYDRWNQVCYLKRSVGTLFLNPKAATGVREGAPSPSLSEEPVQIDRYRRKGFPDTPYSTPAANSLPACDAACRSDEICMAYTFLTSQQRCLLFNHPGQYFGNDDAVSGVKIQRY